MVMPFDDVEELNLVGTWWVPGRDQPEQPGILHFSPEERPKLELSSYIDFLTKPASNTYTDRSFSEFFPVVCGRTAQGPMTLLSMQNGKADFIISEALFKSEEEARFRKIRLQFQHALEWLGQLVIQNTTYFSSETDTMKLHGTMYNYQPLPEEIFLANGVEYKIFFELQTIGSLMTSLTLYPKACLEISSPDAKSVHEWWYSVVLPLRDLFSLAIDRPIDTIRFEVIDEREESKNWPIKRVFFKKRNTVPAKQELCRDDMLFVRGDITHNNIGELIEHWLNMYDESSGISMCCKLYSSATSIREQYLEEEFINFAHAAELYHRAKFDSSVLPKTE